VIIIDDLLEYIAVRPTAALVEANEIVTEFTKVLLAPAMTPRQGGDAKSRRALSNPPASTSKLQSYCARP
jgi:hypothetical protein